MSRATILHKKLTAFILLLLLAAPSWAQAANAAALAPGERLPVGDALSAPAQRHPLMIEVMRDRRYPGSEITIEQTLAAGSNYNRYVASYRSEGLKIYALLTIPRGARPASGGAATRWMPRARQYVLWAAIQSNGRLGCGRCCRRAQGNGLQVPVQIFPNPERHKGHQGESYSKYLREVRAKAGLPCRLQIFFRYGFECTRRACRQSVLQAFCVWHQVLLF